MAPLWLWFRSELRRRWRSWAALALLVGLAGGVVIGSVAGARRTATAYERFLKASNPSDVAVMAVPFPIDLDAVRRLPEVANAINAPYAFLDPAPGEPQREFAPILVPHDPTFTQDRSKLLGGRRANPDRADEATVNSVAARLQGVDVGTVLRLQAWTPQAARDLLQGDRRPPDGILVEVKVVGIEVTPGDLLPSEQDEGTLFLTPAFARQYGDQIGRVDLFHVQLRRGAADVASFKAGVERIAGDEPPQFLNLADERAQVQRSIDLQAVALGLFAILAGVASLLILGQALARHVLAQADEQPTLSALGLTRSQRWLGAMLGPCLIAIAGALVAGVVAVLGSALTPFGVAQDAEPDPGFAFDGTIVPLGLAATVLLVLIAAAFPAWRATRAGLASAAGTVRPSRLTDALARAGLPPSALTGARMALEAGRGRSALPTRAALGGTALSVLALVMALTFGASLQHLLGTPRLYGWSWDVVIGSAFLEDISDQVVPSLGSAPAVAEVSALTLAEMNVGGVRTPVFGFEGVKGDLFPPVVSGREPRRADEIVLGAKTLRAVGRRVGDSVTVRLGDLERELRIVGRAVLPTLSGGDVGGLGDGGLVTGEGLAQLAPGVPRSMFVVRFAPDAGEAEREEALAPFEGRIEVRTAAPPSRVADFGRVDDLPVVLAVLLALVATATLVHTLVFAVRRRRRDLAILKTLGFVRAQVRRTVAWHACTLTAFALAVGIPLGAAGGRWAWMAFADRLGTVPELVVPVVGVLLTIPAALVLANVVAAMPARAAARTRPALVLRSE